MKLDIPYYIRQVLREQRMVHIPGIGTFRLDQTAADFNDDKTVITPPSLNITFDDSDSDDNSLLKYILDTGLLTESKAKKKIEQFTQSAFNKLINVDSFLIDGIGNLVKKVGQDNVEFEPNVSDLTRELSDLVSLNLTPISRIAEQNTAILETASKPQVEESGSFLPRVLLLSLLLIALWFTGRYFYNLYSAQPEDENTEIQDQKKTEEEDSLAELNEKELEQKYEEIDELIDPLKEKESTNEGDSKLDEELNNLAENTETKQEDKVEVGKEDEKESKNAEVKIDSPTEKVETKSVDDTETIQTPTNKYADIIPGSGECIIIVGSFIKSLNSIKMVSLLERKGYKVYQGEYKGYSRIGIKYDCSDEDLEAYLQNIRKKISKRAWYLDPDLEIPYLK